MFSYSLDEEMGVGVHKWGPGMWFHPHVLINEFTFKYGVIADTDFLEDLTQWSHLYIAGRLHKPVRNEYASHNCHLHQYCLLFVVVVNVVIVVVVPLTYSHTHTHTHTHTHRFIPFHSHF
jgi:hypothetical protein